MKRDHEVLVEAFRVRLRGVLMARERELVLLLARECHSFAVISMLSPIESFVRGSITPGNTGLKCRGRSLSQGVKRCAERSAARALEQQRA